MKKSNTSQIEQYVIDKVREYRQAKNFSQRDLAAEANLSIGFIGDVESTKSRAKYNLNHLNMFAKIFDCSPQDFLPDQPF